MNTIFKNKPVYKNNSLYTALLYFLSIITSAISMMPVTVAFMSRFTQLETNADILFVILKGLFAVSLLIAVNAIAIYKDVIFGTIPAFFAGIFMALCYSISYGIAAGFIFYCLTKICKKEIKDIHPILWVATGLFILNFVLLALL